MKVLSTKELLDCGISKISAGLCIRFEDRILLVHPTGSPRTGFHSIPKGAVEANESVLNAAVRETREETGIDVPERYIDKRIYHLDYLKKYTSGKAYKRVYYFNVRIQSLSDIDLDSYTVPKNQLQLDEVDYAAFIQKDVAKNLLLKRQHKILETIR